MPEPLTPPKVPLSERFKAFIMEYGSVGVVVYLVIFALVWGGFVLAISLGFHQKSHTATAGTVGAAYLATQLTKPLRIAATLVVTPVVMKVLRIKKRGAPSSPESGS